MPRKKKGQIVIRKSNRLVEAKYRLDIWETRVFTKALSMIKKDDDDFTTYRIYLTDLIEEFGLVKGLSYKYLKEAAKSLNKRTVIIVRDTENGKREFQTNIVTGVDTALDDNASEEALYIEVDFHRNLRSSLLELKREFTTYDIRNVVSLPSSYSYRVYELLKQYEKIKTRKFELKELKEIVGAIETFDDDTPPKDHYPLYGNFRQKVLLKAQRDLKKFTDITFTFEPIKRGRKVVGIIFYIEPNKPIRDFQEEKEEAEAEQEDTVQEAFDKVFPLMKYWQDIDEASVKKLISKYGAERIFASCSQTREDLDKGIIRGSVGKYFYGLAHNAPTLFDQRKEKAETKKKKKQKQQKVKEAKQAIVAEIDNLNEIIGSKNEAILSDVKANHKDIYEKVVEAVKANRFYDRKLSYQENMARVSFGFYETAELRKFIPDRYEEVIELQRKVKELQEQERSIR